MSDAGLVQQAIVADFGLYAVSSTDQQALLDRAVEVVAEALDVELVSVAQLAPGRASLRLVAGLGWEPGDLGRAELSADLRSQAGYTLRQALPVVMTDARREARYRLPRFLSARGVVSDVSVAVPGVRRPFGVLGAHSRLPREFSDDDAAFMQAIANTLGAALDRARLETELRRSEAARQRVLEEMIRAQQRERAAIATELHDDSVQAMTATLFALDRLTARLGRAGKDDDRAAAERAREALTTTLDRTRRLMFELRPALLEAGGLRPAVEQLTAQLAEDGGFEAHVNVTGTRFALPLEELVYRTVREALTNVRKYARARHVRVSIEVLDGWLHGAVVDDGVGFDVARALDRTTMHMHLGLDSLIEGVRLAGGHASVHSRRGAGTRVAFRLPLEAWRPAPRGSVGEPAIA